MMRFAVAMGVAFCLAVGGSAADEQHPGDTVPFGTSGLWVNQDGSILSLDFSAAGLASGYFINKTPGFGCTGTPYPVTGWELSEVVAFAVRWNNPFENCNAVTSWAGNSIEATEGAEISATWTLVSQTPDGKPTVTTGKDFFKPVAKIESPSPVK